MSREAIAKVRHARNGYLLVAIMDRDDLRHHIESAAPFGRGDERRLASLLVAACWPGGPEDRAEPAALDWLRHRHPKPATLELPACSCATGRCVICG